MEPSVVSANIFRFGLFQADAAGGTLMRNGVRIKLQDQPFRVLLILLERPGEIVTREELRQKLWAEGTFVDFENGLNTATNRLRAALCDSAELRYNPYCPNHGDSLRRPARLGRFRVSYLLYVLTAAGRRKWR